MPEHSAANAAEEPRAKPERTLRVLFALAGRGRPTASLNRTRRLATALGADLHVVRVVPGARRLNVLFPQRNLPEALEALEQANAAVEETQAWIGRLDDLEVAPIELAVRGGNFTEAVAAYAAEIGADLIALPPREGGDGARVTGLVRASGRPVFVARVEATDRGAVVAATDLASENLGVLRQAAVLARQLGTPLVALHDIPPVLTYLTPDGGEAVSVWPNERVSEACARRMVGAWDALQVSGRVVVRRDANPADAIIREAAARNADVIVVGWHRRSWVTRLLRPGVAASVVDRAERSVWVTPLDPPSGGFAPPPATVGGPC